MAYSELMPQESLPSSQEGRDVYPPEHIAGPQQVPPTDDDMYAIESAVVAATPSVVDTGSPEEFVAWLHEGGKPTTYLWHDDAGHQVGYLALVDSEDAPDDMEVRSIAVLPKYQDAAFGKAMMQYAEDIARQQGKKKVTLVTSPANEGALGFYQHLGYSIVRTVDNYYGDGTPRHVLEKSL